MVHKPYDEFVHRERAIGLKPGQRLEVPGGQVELVTIDPKFARELLANKHPNQRIVRAPHVDTLANAMANDRWYATLTPICLDEDLRLIDGQHRLLAVVKSNTSHVFMVAILSDPKAFYAIDQGAGRSLNDIRATLGKPSISKTISGAILLENRKFGPRAHRGLSKEDIDRILDEFPYMDDVKDLFRHNSTSKIVTVGPLAAAIAALRVNQLGAHAFFGAVFRMSSVVNGEEAPVARLLYTFLSRSRTELGKTTGEHFVRESAWKSVRAWNAWRTGEDISRLLYDPNAKFPKARR